MSNYINELISDSGVLDIKKFVSGLQKEKDQELQKTGDFPKISIVTPSYNHARYIERTILSVLNQGYPNLEFIIVDGGSTDGSVEIIKKYEQYLSHWRSVPDAGQSDALNYGFSKATGDIFGWLNSDDLYLPGAFIRAAEVLKDNSEAGVVFGDWWEIDSEDEVISVNYAFDFSLGHFIHEGFHLNSQAMFWRCEVHRRFGLFDVQLHRTMDYDLILRLGQSEGQAAFKRVSQPLACFRRHAEQKTIGFNRVVHDEHRRIASKNGIGIKYSLLGKACWFIYRIRRAYWYIRRGGLRYAITRTSALRARLRDMVTFSRTQ